MAPPAPKKSRTAPKFNAGHLDPHRARKLKKGWIATQKLKAKYRAEKRRMGLGRSSAEHDDEGVDGNAGERDDTAKDDSSDTEPPVNSPLAEPDTTPQSPVVMPSRTQGMRSKLALSKPTSSKSATSRSNMKTATTEDKPEQDGPSLRELAREAYSPASLHTFKSHPLHRRSHGKNNTRAQVNPYPNRTGANGQGGTPSRSRGQPNMAKRMGVLLERIKRSSQ
ncbi:unnamed protein product [Rhizoctonia solani]|uniref:rRNA-processing protein FYV7 n=1 Tax=Rhizoctonia solani TaxID=456999 RepID=A0A8H3D9R4_9AGAM|nr:unnamed protein product [Rhizoctonia solani]